ncbi:DUF2612 domain-containing protein [Bacillus sp. ISL-46]|uniref:DUF2612 domain-containing protein n=1 Tax=Bacillus sp. ISL-46 TaxID=2819129 RepID=UPI001BE8501F|nr:DUF2612 domain-containing protein [Bacillus sp. ISL-46]MBT2722854.1 hypothetical protein [Bacillus sp. ISL-46]
MAKKKHKKKNNNKPRIKDNYSFKEMETSISGMQGLQELFAVAEQFGLGTSINQELFKDVPTISKQFKELTQTLDRFNHFFAKKGWIAFESLNHELMEKCVKLAEDGRTDDAERELVGFFTERENVNFLANRLKYIEEFKPRRDLLINALDDHFSGRYYASVPLFLMLIDGFVNEFERYGFFAEKVDLSVWDTIAAHESGLGTVAKILGKSRKKTTNEEINLPFRNGILHGRDLGYGNIQVSSKALATLLSLADWARGIKEGKKGITKEYEPPKIEETTEQLAKSLELWQESRRQSEFMEGWKPREITVGDDIPANGSLTEYGDDTPEKSVIEYLGYIEAGNYGTLAKMTTNYDKVLTEGKLAGRLREIFKGKKLVGYELVSVTDTAPAISKIEIKLVFDYNGEEIEDNRKFRLIYVDENDDPVARGYKKAEWKAALDFYNIEYLEFLGNR